MRTSLRPRRLRLAIAIASTFVLAGSGVTLGHAPPDDGHADSGLEIHGTGHHQHGGTGGHLPGSVSNVELIGQLTVGDAAEGKIADVAVWGDYAYLGSFFQDACFGPERVVDGGVYIVDISDPSDPIEVGFIRTQQDTYVGEGVQVISVDTPQFDGDILVINNESCTLQGKGGVSIYDVTDPLKPKMLVEHAGDRNVNFARFGKHANDIHSAFAWDAGDRAYVVLVDDLEFTDVDILDITDPRKPRLIAEYDLDADFDVFQSHLGSGDSFFHDVVVKQIDGTWTMLASYWDGGYVLLDVDDPANATWIADSEFGAFDPEFPTQLPTGNAHQAEFSLDNQYVVAADEDFQPWGLLGTAITVDGVAYAPAYEGAFTPPVATQPVPTWTGTIVWTGGLGCTPAEIPPAPGDGYIALIERGVCFFQDKAEAAFTQGYDGFVVYSDAARPDDVFPMGARDGGPYPPIPGAMVRHADGLAIRAAIEAGSGGAPFSASGVFDGFGYVHLFDASDMSELDTWVLPEAKNPAMAEGFGDLSVHEVAMSHQDARLAYLSHYSGGFRVLRIVDDELTEVGHYIDEDGNNFWGVQVFERGGTEYVAASDRDSGLWIFRYTGDD